MIRVWLVGGPSSTGKTTACTQLAEQLGGRLLSIDKEFGELTYPPNFHGLLAAGDLPGLLKSLREKETRLASALTERVEELRAKPGLTIIEGEGWTPGLMADLMKEPGVFAVMVVETDADRMRATLSQCSASFRGLPIAQRNTLLALNTAYGVNLEDETKQLQLPVVSSFPMETLAQRLLEAMSSLA